MARLPEPLRGEWSLALVLVALFASVATCYSADQDKSARRYKACMDYAQEVDECGRP